MTAAQHAVSVVVSHGVDSADLLKSAPGQIVDPADPVIGALGPQIVGSANLRMRGLCTDSGFSRNLADPLLKAVSQGAISSSQRHEALKVFLAIVRVRSLLISDQLWKETLNKILVSTSCYSFRGVGPADPLM